jgi:outer membrane protein OmpA-like peptidoglycan-associated protein
LRFQLPDQSFHKLVCSFAGALLLFIASSAAAQESSGSGSTQPSAGLMSAYSVNYHKTQAQLFQNCVNCGNFDQGTGGGFSVGAFGTLPVWLEGMGLYAGLSYAQRGGTFGIVNTGLLPILDPNTNKYVTLMRKNSASANLRFAVLDIGLEFKPIQTFPLYARATINISAPLGSASSYRQTEEILSPQGVLYPDTHTTTHEVANGVISGIKIPIGAAGALGYQFPIGIGLTAAPEIRYYLPFTAIVSAYQWKVRSLEFGLAFRYSPPGLAASEAPDLEPPKVAQKKMQLVPPIAILSTVNAPHLNIVETIVTETFPLLPYVFFDSASDQLPARYHAVASSATGSFQETDLPHHSLEAYHHILNVIGSRMTSETSYALVLNGTTDGKEAVTVAASVALATRRAAQVKDYLVATWGVAEDRITVSTSTKPTFPSTLEFPEGIAENRRVELSSPNDELLRPILHERFKEYAYEPEAVPFTVETDHPADVDHWKMTVDARNKNIWEQSGTGRPPTTISLPVTPELTAKIATATVSRDSLQANLMVASREGLSSTSRASIPSTKATNPFELSRLSLIVFDFDKFDITPQNQRMISHFVAHSILDSSKSTIIGSTDNLGEAKHNEQLSQGRAFAVRDLILQQ